MDARIATLKNKFSASQLSESIWLFTRQVTTLEQLSEEQLEVYYLKFFPPAKTVEQALFETQKQLNFQLREQKLKDKISTILTIATKCGIKEKDSWDKFNAFMLKSSILKKHLNAYNVEELNALIRQFKQIESNYEESAKKVFSKAHMYMYNHSGFSEN